MNHKQQIKNLRDNAELAWAAYGYFDLFLEFKNTYFWILNYTFLIYNIVIHALLKLKKASLENCY
ncbi:hypothetical protein DCO58_05915 [Helicobacter saguini]|uniref:Uncharacterized protein n=1 Tax=Helicobacter saguini TaxID=1548018 RepID=A0A347VTF5_9HELI|nr:hypothetical protein [Helicobacter saguini]MWV62118.1 hypothetical protein [Helicobacter saguini]MWV67210.1 hypothetical protein [Helicobacter saguini]MWV69562.1 hypothetical protein [Helicobacter saguini]MWV70887.1 hypothetical protein [Helicobacter saguini]TLD94281.1 hypothetical protein LS64_006030 [Helicobacter saguini]